MRKIFLALAFLLITQNSYAYVVNKNLGTSVYGGRGDKVIISYEVYRFKYSVQDETKQTARTLFVEPSEPEIRKLNFRDNMFNNIDVNSKDGYVEIQSEQEIEFNDLQHQPQIETLTYELAFDSERNKNNSIRMLFDIKEKVFKDITLTDKGEHFTFNNNHIRKELTIPDGKALKIIMPPYKEYNFYYQNVYFIVPQ